MNKIIKAEYNRMIQHIKNVASKNEDRQIILWNQDDHDEFEDGDIWEDLPVVDYITKYGYSEQYKVSIVNLRLDGRIYLHCLPDGEARGTYDIYLEEYYYKVDLAEQICYMLDEPYDEFERPDNTGTQNLRLVIDEESVNIFRQPQSSDEPLHIVYWTRDEWIKDPEIVVPAIMKAIELYYTDQELLLTTLGLQEHIMQKEGGVA